MHASDLNSPNATAEPAVRADAQPFSSGLPAADPGPLNRSIDSLVTDLAGLVDDPGAIEYASWMRLIRAERA